MVSHLFLWENSLYEFVRDHLYQSAESNILVLSPSLPKYSQPKNFSLKRFILRLVFRFIFLLSWFSDVIILVCLVIYFIKQFFSVLSFFLREF